MAHFICGCSGKSKTAVSRLGSKNSGAQAYASGWDIGGEVRVWASEGKDYLYLRINRGSNRPSCIASIEISDDNLEKLASGELSLVLQDNPKSPEDLV